MKYDLIKLGRISAVLFLTLAVAGCGGGLSSSSLVPGGGSDGENVGNGSNGGGGPGGMGGGPGGMGGGPGGMAGGGGPGGMGGGGEPGGGGPGGMGGHSSASDAQADAADSGVDAAQGAASNDPAFGSVTQSSNQDANGVTSDHASATFTDDGGPKLVVTVTRADGSMLSLDSATDVFENEPFEEALDSPENGTSYAVGPLYRHTETEFTVAVVSVDWDSSDATDYLAGGYWLNATLDSASDEVVSAEIGAFVDGPEIRGTPDLPVTGTATYNGIGLAGGVYAAEYGADLADADIPEGSDEIGAFVGDIELTADFGARNISGAVDNISLSFVTVAPSGEVLEEVDEEAVDYVLQLGMAPFGSGGTFTGTDVELTHPGLAFDTDGSWGGKFSTEDDSDGNPRLVAGTLGGNATSSGGTSAVFVGAFIGTTSVRYHDQ